MRAQSSDRLAAMMRHTRLPELALVVSSANRITQLVSASVTSDGSNAE
jgi:hypothetical protein